MLKKFHQKFVETLSNLNYNISFNKTFNLLTILSIFYAIFVLIKQETNIVILIIDLIFLILFGFELIVRYLASGNLKKFWKNYYIDVIALIGWIPFYYFSEFALLRIIRLLRLLTVIKILTTIDKKLRLLIRNIFIIFVITVFLILVASSVISINYGSDVINSLQWSLYVIFTGEIPEGLEKKQLFWIGMILIMSNGLLLAGIIGTVSSYIMEKFRNLTDFDSIPDTKDIVIIINYDKEIISSLIKEYFESLIKNKRSIETKVVIISTMNDKDYEVLTNVLENIPFFEIIKQNVYIVNENPLLVNLYEKLVKMKEKIKRIFILPDERIDDDYHKDTNVAFISMNIVNYLGKEFSRRKVFALTNTDIVNIPHIHLVRSYEIISKLINIEISIPYIGLAEQFLVSFNNRIIEIPISSIISDVQNINQIDELIKYIQNKYKQILIGYINKDGKFVNIIPMYSEFLDPQNQKESIKYTEIQSLLVMK
ncbi:MAG: ion transporter [bacterium]|nr:ion transporter [bacterium]